METMETKIVLDVLIVYFVKIVETVIIVNIVMI